VLKELFYALSCRAVLWPVMQSTKLCIHEERVLELVLETKHMPQSLAQHGTVTVTAEEVAQRIGQVFIQRVSLLHVPTHDLYVFEHECVWLCGANSLRCSMPVVLACQTVASHHAKAVFWQLEEPGCLVHISSHCMRRGVVVFTEVQYHSQTFVLCVVVVQAAVNLLGSVLDTPEFFWSAPDQLQVKRGGTPGG
jgi:hypothetical protein